jgi:hypothetical protein
MEGHLGVGGELAQAGHDLAQQHRVEIVRGGNVEDPAGAGRVELDLADGDGFDLLQCNLDRLKQPGTPFSGGHAVAAAHQQLVAGDIAEAAQGRADGRLRLVEATRRLAHAAFGEQGVEYAQQVDIHGIPGAVRGHVGAP